MTNRTWGMLIGNLRGLAGPGGADDELLQRFAERREEDAFAALVHKHGPMVWAACRRVLSDLHDCEDAFQATFLALVRKAASLERGRPLAGWLYTVAVNTALKVRARGKQRSRMVALEPEPAARADAANATSGLLDAELNRLPASYRTPLVLCYFEGKTHEQTAAALGWPVGTVKGRLARARELLRGRLVRSGLTLSSAGLAALLAENSAAAAPPLVLVDATIGAGLQPQASVSTRLAEEVLQAMFLSRLKRPALLLSLLVLIGGGLLALNWPVGPAPDHLLAAVPEEVGEVPSRVDRPAAARSWQVSTLPDKKEERAWIEDFLTKVNGDAKPLPAFQPVVMGDLVIFRTHDGVHARHLGGDGQAGSLSWLQNTGGSSTALNSPWARAQLETTRNTHTNEKSLPIFRRPTQGGVLSADARHAYFVDDLFLPPPRFDPALRLRPHPWTGSILAAAELESGKLIWVFGDRQDESILAESYFLGPPLLVADKLYVLNEKEELRLVCLGPPEAQDQRARIHWHVKLAKVGKPVTNDPARRVQAVHLAYGDGMLVCPTNMGAVFGVDVLTHALSWSFNYTPAGQSMGASPIFIDGRKVVVAPGDARTVFCLDLRDGTELWKIDRGDDVQLVGIHKGKVLLASPDGLEALDLDNGQRAWRCPTGKVSGRPAVGDGVVFVPLRAGLRSKKAEICAVDLERGSVTARCPVKDVPGNLVLGADVLLSQTATELTAYPRPRP